MKKLIFMTILGRTRRSKSELTPAWAAPGSWKEFISGWEFKGHTYLEELTLCPKSQVL